MSVQTVSMTKRIFYWAAAQAFVKAIGYAGTFIKVACQVYNWLTGDNVQGSMPYTIGPVLTTRSGAFYMLDGVNIDTTRSRARSSAGSSQALVGSIMA
jgi:hypothetical protein